MSVWCQGSFALMRRSKKVLFVTSANLYTLFKEHSHLDQDGFPQSTGDQSSLGGQDSSNIFSQHFGYLTTLTHLGRWLAEHSETVILKLIVDCQHIYDQ